MLANTRRSLAESDDTEVVRLYEQWLTKKREIASRVRLRGATRGDSVAADRLSREVEMLEKELTTRSASFAERQSRKRSTWRDVQRSLEPGEAAAEIIRIPHGDLRSKYDAQPVYAALILTPNTTNHPRLVQLGEALTLEGVALDRYLDFRDTIWGGAYEAFWRSMEGGLEGVRRLYLAPDGVYGRIDLNILFDEKRQSFLMDSLDLRIVASTRDALKARRVSDRGRTAVLVGRPAYDRAPAEASADSARAPAEDLRSIRFHPQSGERLHFRDLAGTEREVSEIDALLCDRGWKVTVLLGECASRASLLSVESPTVLHIATHGFYLDPGEIRFRNAEGESILMFEDSTNLEAQPGFAKLQEVLAESGFVRTAAVGVRRTTAGAFPGTTVLDPLLRSGLALAGASREILSTDLVADDGILTAYDATGLELERTELVVLSACESGRGELRAAEGAFGMERALRAAGAKTILATLWPVDDAITRELMAAFYASWLESGDARAALRASQQQLRLKYRLPMLWGGFVLIGR
jgi:CHAT domain-containing protein